MRLGRAQDVERIPLPAPSALVAGGVVDNEHFFDAEAGGAGEGAEFFVDEDVAPSCALRLVDVPNNGDVAIHFVPGYAVAKNAQGRSPRSIMAGIVTVIHVDEDRALRRHQAGELT
jgi:hypothetical protein